MFATRTGACACMIPSINCEFIDFESLNDKDFSSGLVEIFLFSNCLKYTYHRAMFPIQLRPDAFCLFVKQNRTNHVVWVRLVRLSSVIELTEKFQFDYVRLPNQSNNNPADWVRLIFGSVSFDWLCRVLNHLNAMITLMSPPLKRAKQLSMAANSKVISVCACVRSWPYLRNYADVFQS